LIIDCDISRDSYVRIYPSGVNEMKRIFIAAKTGTPKSYIPPPRCFDSQKLYRRT
jgi:hypothetical protein